MVGVGDFLFVLGQVGFTSHRCFGVAAVTF